jgi:hypothetical protein
MMSHRQRVHQATVATLEKEKAELAKKARRYRKMLRLIVAAGHYNPGGCCAACDATAEVLK